MKYIYLDDQQTRKFFLNKYLESEIFFEDSKPKLYYNSFRFFDHQNVITFNNKQIVYLSQFQNAVIKSERDLNIFLLNYNLPQGFLELGKSTSNFKFKFESENLEIEIDSTFLSIRRALLNGFEKAFSGSDEDLTSWFSLLNELRVLPLIIAKMLPVIIEMNDFPQIEMTAKLAKSTKIELQFIYFGRLLGEIYFQDFQGKTDDEHREWLMALNPAKELKISNPPERFKADFAVIVGFITALKTISSDSVNSIEGVKLILKSSFPGDSISGILNQAIFYCFFWLGLLSKRFDNYFHTRISASLLLALDIKAYELRHNSIGTILPKFENTEVDNWLKLKREKNKPSGKRFKEYCKMYSGNVPKERTQQQIIEKIEPYNLLTKKVLIVFFRNDSSLNSLWVILQQLRFIEVVLLVYKQEFTKTRNDIDIENDILISSIKRQFAKNYSKIQFEIVLKNMLDNDDRDIINNLKGFMNKHCGISNFVYLSDSNSPKESLRENLWLGTAFNKAPIFNDAENYIFI